MTSDPQGPMRVEPLQLEYNARRFDPNAPVGRVPPVVQGLIGFVWFFAAGIVCVIVCGASSSGLPLIFWPVLLIGGGCVAAGRWKWRGVIAGMLIALGLVVLLLGWCFGMFALSFRR